MINGSYETRGIGIANCIYFNPQIEQLSKLS